MALPFPLCAPNSLPCTSEHITDLLVVMCLWLLKGWKPALCKAPGWEPSAGGHFKKIVHLLHGSGSLYTRMGGHYFFGGIRATLRPCGTWILKANLGLSRLQTSLH